MQASLIGVGGPSPPFDCTAVQPCARAWPRVVGTLARLRKRRSSRYAPRRVVLALVCALWCSLGLAPTPAGIEVAGEPCAGARLEDRVRQFVSAEQQTRAGVLVEAHLRRTDDGQWLLDLVIDREGAQDASARELVAPHCETVIDAAAFVIAVAVDPTLAAGATPRETPPPEPEIPPPTTGADDRRAASTSTTPAPTTETRRVAPPREP